MANLNPRQKEAVEHLKGPLMIIAGAGAGKTKTLTERIRRLISSGVSPSNILAITFTNKAAREMRERIDKGLREDSSINRPVSIFERPFVSTFHSLGVHILREQAHRLSLKRHFAIFDRGDSKKAVKEALETIGLDPKTHDPNRILSVISKEKGKGMTHQDWSRLTSNEGQNYFRDVLGQVWPEYEKILKRDSALDFDDLLLKTLNLLRDDREVRDYYKNIWQHIHVDEYQDTNRVQYEISKLLVGSDKNICVVGDIDQNIYSWRGADIKNIIDFETDYPEAHVITLEENYRSTKNILEAANAVIEKNEIRRKKNLFTSNSTGEKIGLFQALDEVAEAEFIASKTNEVIKEGVDPSDIAVLYRANFQSRLLEEAFINYAIPYQVLGTRFFERKEVKDIVSFLRAALNPESLSDLKRVINLPARGIGKVTIAKVFSGQEASLPAKTLQKITSFRKILEEIGMAPRTMKLSEVIAFIIKRTGLEDEWKSGGEEGEARLENAYELVNFASRYDDSGEEAVLDFLSDVSLQSDQDEMKEEKSAVRLMTVHASKGLEFNVVFIAGLEDGLFPHEKLSENKISQEESEEERRLFYVAITRARKKVYLSYAQMRTIFGRAQSNMPSEFITDIPESLLEEETFNESLTRRKPLLEIEF